MLQVIYALIKSLLIAHTKQVIRHSKKILNQVFTAGQIEGYADGVAMVLGPIFTQVTVSRTFSFAKVIPL